MDYTVQLRLHKGFLGFGVGCLAVGFLMLYLGLSQPGFWVIVFGAASLLGGVATTFARDKDGKERLVEDIVRESDPKEKNI